MCAVQQKIEELGKLVYFFGEGSSEGDPERKDLLGGKGASLAAMCRTGLAVPPGFTLSVECCKIYLETGKWPKGLEQDVKEYIAKLEKVTGRKFGEGANPLLVSVRSGAACSMPGMMDTILNCGLHTGLADVLPDKEQFWDVYAQFVMMFSKTVAGIPDAEFEEIPDTIEDDFDKDELIAEAYKNLYKKKTGKDFPETPWQSLIECIEAVFNSWNSERAIVYRKYNDIHGLMGTAVNVQSMFPSQISGIGFTANPTDPSANVVILESSYGLGEAIVSGDVTPDRFVLDKDSLAIEEETIGNKARVVSAIGDTVGDCDPFARSLTDDQIAELGRMALQLEEYFGFPIDFEWGWADGKFALLQSRAVRGLDIALDVEVGRRAELERLTGIASDARKVWVIHNLSETLQQPTPLTWDIVSDFMKGNGGFGLMYQDFGYHPSDEVKKDGFLELITGRIYADPSRTANLFWEGMPLDYDLDEIAEDPNLLDAAPTKFDADKADETFLIRLPKTIIGMIRSSRRMKKARANAIAEFDKALEWFLKYIEEKRKQDLSKLSVDAVVSEIFDRRKKVLNDFGKESLKPGFFGGVARGALEQSLVQLMGDGKAGELCAILTSGLEGDSTLEQNAMLYKVAHGEADLNDFVNKYGHRTVSEMELAQSRWREDQSYLEQMIKMFKQPSARSPEDLHAANSAKRKEVEKNLPSVLKEWGGSCQLEDFMELIQEAQALLPYREIGKHYLMMGYEVIRLGIVELGRRWDLGRDVFFLRFDELVKFESDRDNLEKKIEERKVRWQSAQRLDYARVIDSDKLDGLGLTVVDEDEYDDDEEDDDVAEETVKTSSKKKRKEFKADALAAGVFKGRAHIVFDPKDAGEIASDCVLVCPSTDPGWTALFAAIKGLIVERGGALSHGAITARDFGIPAVACSDATKKIKEGDLVRVDGNRGKVVLLEV
ncbi:MAG: hypothetical protein KAH23_00385 [Kiritimatiellae bacterium]|nr:hypothetical protein [Kiritimatiellia bacterium]